MNDTYGDSAWVRTYESRMRCLGTRAPSCGEPGCCETNPFALTGVDPNIVCYEHQAQRAGRPWVEAQHPQGQHNDPFTVPMLGNDHRVVDVLKADWPKDTLRNPTGSPLLKAAAMLRGWLDTLRLITDRTVGWIPALLEWLEVQLVERLGASWWVTLGWTGAL